MWKRPSSDTFPLFHPSLFSAFLLSALSSAQIEFLDRAAAAVLFRQQIRLVHAKGDDDGPFAPTAHRQQQQQQLLYFLT